jgi:hypothetical protein
MNCSFVGIVKMSKLVLHTDFSTPQGHSGLAPVEMTKSIILSEA